MLPVQTIAAAVTLVMLGRFCRELAVVLPWIFGSATMLNGYSVGITEEVYQFIAKCEGQ